jgi:rhodanese-related sulfurtransferase
MVSKGFKEMVAAANAAVDAISVEAAQALLGSKDAVFVDVRESQENQAGAIPGSVHAPRGFLEFIADPEGPMHKPELASGKQLIIYCATGGRSALAAQTLKEMGLDNVANLVGGITAWKEAGGAVE